jgi:GTP-binding protein EngB required for normal cell division
MSEIPTDNVNLCFVGGVSTGKSTILNAIFCEELTQCKIKRTTMVPTVYVENNTSQTTSDEIYKKITEKNKDIIERTERGEKIAKNEYKEMVFQVGPLDISILEGSRVNVYDIPGLNDARTKDVYYEYLDTNFFKFNLVVFIVDIHSGLNTSDEIDIVNFITNNTRHQLQHNNRKIYTLVVVNKADDMQIGEEGSDVLELTGELSEMYDQVVTTITAEFAKKSVADQLIGIVPLCAVDSYLYRMVKKHGTKFKLSPEQILKIGINENGKKFSTMKPDAQAKKVYEILKDEAFISTMIRLSGFRRMERILHDFLTKNDHGKKIRVDNLLYNIRQLPPVVMDKLYTMDLKTLVYQYYKAYEVIKVIDEDMYELLMVEITDNLRRQMEKQVSSYGCLNDLFSDYTYACTHIMRPEYYDMSLFPSFLTDRMVAIIMTECWYLRPISLESFASGLKDWFVHLKKIGLFDKTHINQILDAIIANPHGARAIDFKTGDLHKLCKVLYAIPDYYDSLYPLLRFLVLNQLESFTGVYTPDDLYRKKMLYMQYGELPIASYISYTCSGPGIKAILRGLYKYEGNELDMMYLKLCKSNDRQNFVYTDYRTDSDEYHSGMESDEEISTNRISISGKIYLIDENQNVYTTGSHELVGVYNQLLDVIE